MADRRLVAGMANLLPAKNNEYYFRLLQNFEDVYIYYKQGLKFWLANANFVCISLENSQIFER